MKFQGFLKYESFIHNIEDKTTKEVLKYKNHPSITAVLNQLINKNTFYFTELKMKDIEKNQNLNTKKACQYSDIPTKIVEEKSDMYADCLCKSMNSSIKASLFSSCLKNAVITPMYKW